MDGNRHLTGMAKTESHQTGNKTITEKDPMNHRLSSTPTKETDGTTLSTKKNYSVSISFVFTTICMLPITCLFDNDAGRSLLWEYSVKPD